MADSGKRRLNYCPKCKMYFMNTHCPICKEYRPQIEYDERFRDLQGIPEKYRPGLRNQSKPEELCNKSAKVNKYGEPPLTKKQKVLWTLGIISSIVVPLAIGILLQYLL